MLEEIITHTRGRVHGIADRMADLRAQASACPDPRGFADAIKAPGLSVIAEIKRRSPSAGDIAAGLDAAAVAAEYAAGGAAALSVLTEPHFFGGSSEDLEAVGAGVALPVLRKDFMVEPAQVFESRVMGADAVLLIVKALSRDELDLMLEAAAQARLDALVEVHDRAELEVALGAGAGVIGVNNRDLDDFTVDLGTAEELRPLIPPGVVAVAESGVSSPESARRMSAAGYDAILVGEAAVRSDDRPGFVASLRAAL